MVQSLLILRRCPVLSSAGQPEPSLLMSYPSSTTWNRRGLRLKFDDFYTGSIFKVSFKLQLIMTFFPNSAGFNIYDGNFMSFNFKTEDAASGWSIQVFFPSLAIDNTEYSHNRWAYGSVSMDDHCQASNSFFYSRFWRQAMSSCVGNLSVTATTVIAYTLLPTEDV